MDIKKLGAETLRVLEPTQEQLQELKASRRDIYIILDNVLDTYNIGSVFRLADAVGAKEILLCEGSETPPNSRIQKASVGTWQWVDWSYHKKAQDAIKHLRETVENIKIVAVELDAKAIDYTKAEYSLPVALLVGHESDGVSQETLSLCDEIVQLPQLGINKSLNVMVSLGIALYEVLEKNRIS